MTKDKAMQLLNLSGVFTQAELKKAYRIMAKKAHPDMPGGSDELFMLVSDANKFLEPYCSDAPVSPNSQPVFKLTHRNILDIVLG